MKRAIFVQSRHPNAPEEGDGQIYMPTAIMTAMARVIAAGGQVEFRDENIAPLTEAELDAADVVGIHTVGPSWIPSSMALQERILTYKPEMVILQGGQPISKLDWANGRFLPEGPRFRQLFGSARNGNLDHVVKEALDLEFDLLPKEATSLVPTYTSLDEAALRRYLSNPFSLYVSQGCAFACSYCPADVTQTDPKSGRIIEEQRVKEQYRDVGILKRDLDWLLSRAEDFGIRKLQMYMSNLDLSQTPSQLALFAQAVREVRTRHPVDLRLTGLSTVAMYETLAASRPEILQAMREAGLANIGFGVEGIGEFLKIINKQHNLPRGGEDKARRSYAVVKHAVETGFTPEILLTPGQEGQTVEEIEDTLRYAQRMKDEFDGRIIIRPYAAKNFVPGNKGWKGGIYDDRIAAIVADPELFQSLDFNARQSSLVEPDPVRRRVINETYDALCAMSQGAAFAHEPIESGMSPRERELVRKANEGMYDH